MERRTAIRAFLSHGDRNSPLSKMTDSDSLLENQVIDSLKMQKLIGYLEKDFGIHVGEDDLLPENFDTIEAIVRFIDSKSKKG